MSDVELTRLIRQMLQAHRAKRPKVARSTFPSREWLVAYKRLAQMQEQLFATRGGGSSDEDDKCGIIQE